jgi:dipeptidase
MERFLNPHTFRWDGDGADYTPQSDDIPWSLRPEKKITIEDVKYLLSSHFQGTPYDPYGSYGDASMRGAYRTIGVNRTDFLGLMQLRPYMPGPAAAVEWLAFGSNVFNALVPFYTNIDTVPEYLSNTTGEVSTDNFYWANRLIAAMADAHYGSCEPHIERYQFAVQSQGRGIIGRYDRLAERECDPEKCMRLCLEANAETADMLRAETQKVLGSVLYEASCRMKNAYSRSDN